MNIVYYDDSHSKSRTTLRSLGLPTEMIHFCCKRSSNMLWPLNLCFSGLSGLFYVAV